MSPIKQFVSYSTEYDLYIGVKDWNELTPQAQNTILMAELLAGDTDTPPEEVIVQYDLIKAQAQGLRGIIVSSALALERAGHISDVMAWDEEEMLSIAKFLKDTSVGQRIEEAIQGREKDVTPLPTEILAELASPDSLDDMLDMTLLEAQEFMIDLLGNNIPSPSHPLYDDFKAKMATGDIAFIVDRGMAVMAARSGFSAGGWGLLLNGLFNLSLLMIIPAIFIWGFWSALGFVAGAIISFRLTRYALVQKVRKAVMKHEEWYRLFLEKGVIRLCKPTGEFL